MGQKETREAIKALVETSYATITQLRNDTDAAMEAIERMRERLAKTKGRTRPSAAATRQQEQITAADAASRIPAQSRAALRTGRRPAVMAPRGPHSSRLSCRSRYGATRPPGLPSATHSAEPACAFCGRAAPGGGDSAERISARPRAMVGHLVQSQKKCPHRMWSGGGSVVGLGRSGEAKRPNAL